MTARRRAAVALAAIAVTTPLVAAMLPASPASAHGTMTSPASRVYACYQEGPETLTNAACIAARELTGSTQPFYDWNAVSILDVSGAHQALISDGQLCSAGRPKYRGLDLPRADWPATKIKAGPQSLLYTATAPHQYGTFTFYITRSGWSPTQSLRWADLEQIGSWTGVQPPWNWTVDVPARSGRALIYSIWQRYNGSAEAFYTCSDVDFGGSTPAPGASTPPPPGPSPSASPATPPNPVPSPYAPAPPAQGGGSWAPNTTYATGAAVTYNGVTYTCRQGHTSLPGWEPANVAALWLAV